MRDDESVRRSLGIREKKILYERAKHKCEFCEREIDFLDMQVGHKIPFSKGGSTSLRNCVCLCYKCNNLQGTDSWNVFLKKMGKQPEGSRTKEILKGLSLQKLRLLAKLHNVKVKGRTEEGLFQDYYYSPSKTQYVNALTKKISEKEIENSLKQLKEPAKKRSYR